MEGIILGIFQAINFLTLSAIALGVVTGIVVGGIPGLTVSMAIVLALPFSFHMPPDVGMAFLIGIYTGGMCGGSISAILLNIPGNPAAVITGEDGYPMALKGEAGKALGTSIIASAVGSMVSFFALAFAAPQIANLAIEFGAPELFGLVFFGMTLICAFSSNGKIIKGLIAGLLGLMFMTIGMDPIDATPRFTFDTLQLKYGVSFIPVMIGLFAIPEMLKQVHQKAIEKGRLEHLGKFPSFLDIARLLKRMIISGLIGTGVGAVPGTGSAVAAVLSYEFARNTSKDKKKFGTGIPEGIAAAEAANNGVTGGALIPMLTLGIPGDPPTAVMLGALMIYGLEPGPLLFIMNPEFIQGILGSLFISIVFLVFIGLLTARLYIKVLLVPKQVLWPVIGVLCVLGSYALRNSLFDAMVMLFFGLIGYALKRNGYPILPIIISVVLGPTLEVNLRRSLLLSDGNPMIFLGNPICMTFILLGIAFVLTITILPGRKKKKETGG
ncbi:tripartite tricarboxylate transporter permease [Thermodesulfobacteriota bacterium]